MRAALVLAGLLVAIPAHAEQLECISTMLDVTTEYVYRIDAVREQVSVSVEYMPTGQPARDAEILDFWHANDAGPLGATSIYLRQREAEGLLPPSMIVVDWTTGSFAVSYVPFIASPGNMIVARNDFECRRLD